MVSSKNSHEIFVNDQTFGRNLRHENWIVLVFHWFCMNQHSLLPSPFIYISLTSSPLDFSVVNVNCEWPQNILSYWDNVLCLSSYCARSVVQHFSSVHQISFHLVLWAYVMGQRTLRYVILLLMLCTFLILLSKKQLW